MDLGEADITLRGRWKKNIQGFDETFQDTASPRMIYVIARLRCVLPQSRLSFPAFVSNLLSKRYGLKIVTLDQFYIKFNFL